MARAPVNVLAALAHKRAVPEGAHLSVQCRAEWRHLAPGARSRVVDEPVDDRRDRDRFAEDLGPCPEGPVAIGTISERRS